MRINLRSFTFIGGVLLSLSMMYAEIRDNIVRHDDIYKSALYRLNY